MSVLSLIAYSLSGNESFWLLKFLNFYIVFISGIIGEPITCSWYTMEIRDKYSFKVL